MRYPITLGWYFLFLLKKVFFFFFFAVLRLELRAYTLSYSISPFIFVMGFFQARVSQTICLGWLWTSIPLISASWVARIAGVSHWHLAHYAYFKVELLICFISAYLFTIHSSRDHFKNVYCVPEVELGIKWIVFNKANKVSTLIN
jgi:hypothetical protein